MQHYDGDVMELSLDFTVTEESPGKRHVVELKPGGKDVSVTNENKLLYIHAMADYKLNRQVYIGSGAFLKLVTLDFLLIDVPCGLHEVQVLPLSNAFYRGLTDLISPSWLKLFNASEFNQVLPLCI